MYNYHVILFSFLNDLRPYPSRSIMDKHEKKKSMQGHIKIRGEEWGQ